MKLVRINMAEKRVTNEKIFKEHALLGGRAFTSEFIAREVDPTCHPLGHNNKMVISPGLLSGTSAPSSGRLSIGFKSPLTGGIKESNSGGTAAGKLARLGIKALIIEEKPKDNNLYILLISKDGVELLDGSKLKGKGLCHVNRASRGI